MTQFSFIIVTLYYKKEKKTLQILVSEIILFQE